MGEECEECEDCAEPAGRAGEDLGGAVAQRVVTKPRIAKGKVKR